MNEWEQVIRCEFTSSWQGEYLERWLFALGLFLGKDLSAVAHVPKKIACWPKHSPQKLSCAAAMEEWPWWGRWWWQCCWWWCWWCCSAWNAQTMAGSGPGVSRALFHGHSSLWCGLFSPPVCEETSWEELSNSPWVHRIQLFLTYNLGPDLILITAFLEGTSMEYCSDMPPIFLLHSPLLFRSVPWHQFSSKTPSFFLCLVNFSQASGLPTPGFLLWVLIILCFYPNQNSLQPIVSYISFPGISRLWPK